MVIFEDIDDVKEWLAPMSYTQLWDAVQPYYVFCEADRDHCDGLVAGGKVPQATILKGTKTMARLALTDMFDLKDRIFEPVPAQYLKSTH